MKNENITLSEIANGYWKEFAIYSLEERAIPSMIDGFKPSQRFIMHSALIVAKDKFKKVAEVAGAVSSYGYHHGEVSAAGAAIKMAAEWSNNVPLLVADGNFGSRFVHEAAQARYIFTKVHKNFFNLFADTDIAPIHPDEDIKVPQYYLPLIPFVLLNGIQGMATGYATNILPYDIKDVIKCCSDYVKGKNIDGKQLTPKFPQFKGTVTKNERGGWDITGCHEYKSKTKLIITEIPPDIEREKYIELLDSLEDDGSIASYDESECNDQNLFRFTVTLSKATVNSKTDIVKLFKLKTSVMENLNVIDQNNKLKEYDSPIALIKDFCDVRVKYVKLRIDTEINNTSTKMKLLKDKIKFIQCVLDNKIKFKNKTKAVLSQELTIMGFSPEHHDALLTMNFYHLTVEEMDKLSSKYIELNDRLSYLKTTTPETEYLLNLDTLAKEYK